MIRTDATEEKGNNNVDSRFNAAAEKAAARIGTAMDSLHNADKLIPLILTALLRRYGRYGLAELVEKGWNWREEK
jgi:hypothetical protein